MWEWPRGSWFQGTVQVFSFFAIATSYIGFVLGLTDFLSDCKAPPFHGLAVLSCPCHPVILWPPYSSLALAMALAVPALQSSHLRMHRASSSLLYTV